MKETSFIARMFRRILISMNIGDKEYKQKVDEFIQSEKLPLKMQETALRNNLTKSLSGDSMTAGTFMKALKVLKITKIHLKLQCFDKDGNEISTAEYWDEIEKANKKK